MVLGSEMLWVISETVTTAAFLQWPRRRGRRLRYGGELRHCQSLFVAFSGITTATGVILGSTLGSGELDKARQEKRWLMTAGSCSGSL